MNTIVALATPLGRSGIGVIRLSGDKALSIARDLVADESFTPERRVAYLKYLRADPDSEPIDEALLTFFQKPHSFTGEDVVEISCHGSPVLIRQVIDRCLSLGARMANPGEFSLRALANGRMNLAEVEAVRDLINAQTNAAARQAMRQMQGEFSHRLKPIKDELLDVIVVLESALEFVEDDLPAAEMDHIRERLVAISESVSMIASTFKAGKLVREGIRVAIVGRPNVGKSSIFNTLLGSERAIVTEVAGTTRDQLHERFSIGDIPVSLIDTAGLRETTDIVESIGVERSKQTMADADLVIAVLDAFADPGEEDLAILRSVEQMRHFIAVNKIDKVDSGRLEKVRTLIKENTADPLTTVVELSAKTGEGLNALRRAMIEPFDQGEIGEGSFLVSDARHYDLLVRADHEINHSVDLIVEKASEEIVLVGLHNALRFLGQITGETTTEDMLTRIFSTFCIGK